MTQTPRMLGRRPPKNAPALKLSSVLTGTVPEHPATADRFSRVSSWILGENDKYGDCGPVSVANSRLLTTTYLTDTAQVVSQDDIFALYRRSGNPNFDPATDADDNGVDMQTMLEAVHSSGIAGTKCLGFAKVDVANLEEIRAAIAIFGFVLFGVNLETAQQAQTDAGGPWDYRNSSEWGGHAVLAGQYTSGSSGSDISVITWAEVIGTTDAFARHQLEEAWVVIWPEHVGSSAFIEGVDQAKLAADFKALTGRDFPVPEPAPTPEPPAPTPQPTPGPTPEPVPVPDEADVKLAKVLHQFVAHPWRYNPPHLARDAKRWLEEKGL